jgi:hypothetical protein
MNLNQRSQTYIQEVLKTEDTLVIAAPNYEERSLKFLEFLKERGVGSNKLAVRLVRLSSVSRRIDILSSLKSLYLRKAEILLNGFETHHIRMNYPDGFERDTLRQKIRDWIQEFSNSSFNVVVDISCLPRSVMFTMVETLNILRKETSKIKQLYVAYAGAGQYPLVNYPQEIGSARGYFASSPLEQVISRCDNIVAILIPGFSGFDCKVVYDLLEESEKPKQIHILLYINDDNIRRTWRTMRANQLLLSEVQTRDGQSIEYFFSLADGFEKIASIATSVAERVIPSTKTLFLVASFAPKPMALSGFAACKNIQHNSRSESLFTEVAYLRGFQYTSPYSLGVGKMSIFEVPILNE